MQTDTIKAISDLLFLEVPLDRADLIFVFGNDWLATMDEVADLYERGFAPKILISGHSALADREESEAVRFMRRGIELGIPREAFLLENNATNTKENIQKSLPIIAAEGGFAAFQSILFVCKTFHARRVLMTARSMVPHDVTIGILPVSDERQIHRDNWWTDPLKQQRVMEELGRIAQYTIKGDLTVL